MKVTTSEIEGSQVVLDMEIEPERLEKAMDRAYRRLVDKVNIPGFRRGKAPRVLVERLVGRETLYNEAMDILLPEAYKEAVEKTGIDPVDTPKVEVVSAEPLTVKATVPVRPRVQLGDYRAIRQSLEVPEVSEEQVDQALENIRQGQTQWVLVDREGQAGDRLTVGLRGRVDVDDETVLDEESAEVVLDPARPILAPGVVEELIGMKAGDRKAFDVTLPQDFQDKDLAGHQAAIEASVTEVKERQVPELNEDLARSLGDYQTVEDLRAAVRKELEQQGQAQARRSLQESILAAVVDQAVAEPPAPWVEEQAQAMIESTKKSVSQQGLTFEQYLRLSNRTEQDFTEEMRNAARQQFKRSLVLGAVADAEGITVSDAEVEVAVQGTLAARQGRTVGAEDRERLRSNLAATLRENRTIARLVEIATGGEGEPVAAAEGTAAGESPTGEQQ